jgi:hypothetical protein
MQEIITMEMNITSTASRRAVPTAPSTGPWSFPVLEHVVEDFKLCNRLANCIQLLHVSRLCGRFEALGVGKALIQQPRLDSMLGRRMGFRIARRDLLIASHDQQNQRCFALRSSYESIRQGRVASLLALLLAANARSSQRGCVQVCELHRHCIIQHLLYQMCLYGGRVALAGIQPRERSIMLRPVVHVRLIDVYTKVVVRRCIGENTELGQHAHGDSVREILRESQRVSGGSIELGY